MSAGLALARQGPVGSSEPAGAGIADGESRLAVGADAAGRERRLLGLTMQLDEPSDDSSSSSSSDMETELEADNNSNNSSEGPELEADPESSSGGRAVDDGEDMETRVAFGVLAAETDFPYAAMRECSSVGSTGCACGPAWHRVVCRQPPPNRRRLSRLLHARPPPPLSITPHSTTSASLDCSTLQ